MSERTKTEPLTNSRKKKITLEDSYKKWLPILDAGLFLSQGLSYSEPFFISPAIVPLYMLFNIRQVAKRYYNTEMEVEIIENNEHNDPHHQRRSAGSIPSISTSGHELYLERSLMSRTGSSQNDVTSASGRSSDATGNNDDNLKAAVSSVSENGVDEREEDDVFLDTGNNMADTFGLQLKDNVVRRSSMTEVVLKLTLTKVA